MSTSLPIEMFSDYNALNTVPDNVDDETFGCIQFAERFQERYGPQHPIFFQGSLENAIKEACMKPAKDVSILLHFYSLFIPIYINLFNKEVYHCTMFNFQPR